MQHREFRRIALSARAKVQIYHAAKQNAPDPGQTELSTFPQSDNTLRKFFSRARARVTRRRERPTAAFLRALPPAQRLHITVGRTEQRERDPRPFFVASLVEGSTTRGPYGAARVLLV